MPSAPNASEPQQPQKDVAKQRRRFTPWMLHLPRNVYILLFFTLGKGFQLTIATLNITYYAHSLGYKPDFIGLLRCHARAWFSVE